MVTVNVTWVCLVIFTVHTKGGMRVLIFIGCVGNLMADSGLEGVIESAFSNMLARKRFPQNFRAL